MSTIRVSIVKTALVVVALAAPGRSTMEPTTSPSWYDDDYIYDDDRDWPNGFNATTAPVCEGSTPDFRDEYGDSCRYYERFDLPGCPEEGDLYAGPMGTAREHCCYCWMDAPTSAPTISTSPTLTPHPTSSPTVSSSPTLTPAPTDDPTMDDDFMQWYSQFMGTSEPPCEGSTPNFEDEFGADCAFYEVVDQPGCPSYGDYFGGPMGTARENCCYCQMEVPSSSPTLTNQPTTATRAPTLPNSTPTIDDDFMQWFGGASSEPPCEGNTPGWVDSFGDGCWYYEMFDAPGCPEEGDLYVGPMGSARVHCCYCWMDAPTSAPTISTSPTFTQHPSSVPTISTSPTLTPAPTNDDDPFNWNPTDDDDPFSWNPFSWPAPAPPCEGNTPGWVDSGGDGCWWYEMFDAPGCPEEGDLYVGPMGSAREHCCYCWMDVPTSAPTISSSPTLTPAPTEPVLCQGSTPNFKDSFGDGCDWYESSDEPGCPHHGNSFFGVMGVANDHCCYCKMSSYLSLTPSSPDIDGYEFKGHGFCTSDDDPFDDGLFGFRIRQAEASTLEECAMACADEHSNDPLFRGVTWMGPYDCFCLVCWEGEEAGVREITGATNLFGGELCYAFTSGSTTESQEPTTTETPVETILGLWESLFGI